MNDSPLISIVLLAHQSEWCIQEALESVRAQSIDRWECLICDDASTDSTGTKIKPFLSDPRIRYVHHEKNLGQASNWAYGIANTTSPWIATLHADDAWHADALKTYLDAIELSPEIDLVIAGWTRVSQTLEKLAHQSEPKSDSVLDCNDAFKKVLRTNPVLPSASAFSRRVIERAGMPNPDYGMLCDRDYFLRLTRHARQVVFRDESVVDYRVHPDSITAEYTANGKMIEEVLRFESELQSMTNNLPDRDRLIAEHKTHLAGMYFQAAISAALHGEQDRCNLLLRHSRRCNPSILKDFKRLTKYCLTRTGRMGLWLLSKVHGRNDYVTSVEPC